jgi:hypothetical protein
MSCKSRRAKKGPPEGSPLVVDWNLRDLLRARTLRSRLTSSWIAFPRKMPAADFVGFRPVNTVFLAARANSNLNRGPDNYLHYRPANGSHWSVCLQMM